MRNEDVPCRYGGEEFILLMPGASLHQTLERAEQVRQNTARMQVQSQNLMVGTVTCSLGVASFPVHGRDLNELLRAADFALYQAKRQGRNQVVVATTDL